MRSLPEADFGMPDIRSPLRYLWWNARAQAPALLGGIGFATAWWLLQALVPAVLGKGIDAVTAKDTDALLTWSAIMLVIGMLQAFTGIMRHRMAVYNWLAAAYRTVQVTARQAARLGATLPKRVSTGEVVSVGNSDISHIGNSMEILPRGTGSVVAIIAVTVILISTSLPLGLLVMFGVPLMAVAIGPLLKPLHRRQKAQRDLMGELSTRSADIVAGLRVLRGIGGEQVFAARYREESQRVRAAGVNVSKVESLLEGAQILLPGVLIAVVTGIGASFAIGGEITAGQLVAFYGYAVFLIGPMRTLTEVADKLTKGHVAARRVVRILSIEPEVSGGTGTSEGGVLRDSYSGVTVQPGVMTAIAAALPEDAIAIADRLGRYADGDVTFGGVDLATLPMAEIRTRILVADNGARLFTGRLRDELDVRGDSSAELDVRGDFSGGLGVRGDSSGELDVRGDSSGERVEQALYAACAEDIIEALPDGLDALVAEAGREFSGGQQQRLRLARALLADPEVLILVEPTSAVDAHSEARIGERLAKARVGKTTLVCTTSPLVLDRTDHVIYVENGRVLAEGTHRDLLATSPEYTATVTRGED
ncbi:ABC transporter transmembrane domain-containing protein [Nonomuraea sp. NPDC049028]|uniref:ABC transporter transmembrane domain-containing protein n=1 Tax=Nonomuraea sp. NPDC049028 TaxID=3364348 RepID=UPI0037149A40